MSAMSDRSEFINCVTVIRNGIKQIFADAEHWNDAERKPYEDRIEPDPSGEFQRLLNSLEQLLEMERRQS